MRPDTVPVTLFRFLKFGRFPHRDAFCYRRLFEENKLYLTNPIHFNDPFDCLASFSNFIAQDHEDQIKNELYLHDALSGNKLRYKPQQLFDAFAKDHARQFSKDKAFAKKWMMHHRETDISKNVRILCLSEQITSGIMWSHYSECHKGFGVELDTNLPPLDAWSVGATLEPVVYDRHRAQAPVDGSIAPDAFYRKGDNWEYEREWRCAIQTNTLLVDDVGEFAEVLPAAIKAVYLGCLCRLEPEQWLVLSRFSEKHPSTLFFQMSPEIEGYNVEPESINIQALKPELK